MPQRIINIGTGPNTKDGDIIRTAFDKVNQNFSELYAIFGQTSEGFIETDIKGSVFAYDSNSLVDAISGNLNGNVITGTSIIGGNIEINGSSMSTTDSSSITIDQIVNIESDLNVGGNISPTIPNGGDLGSIDNPWRSLYVSSNTIFIGGTPLSIDETGNILVDGTPVGMRFTQPAPISSVGQPGDTEGIVSFDSEYIYYCTQNFGGNTCSVIHDIVEGTSADGVNNGYLVVNTYQLPEVGWKVYYNGEVRTINQFDNGGIPGYYVVFVDTPLTIPGQATFSWGPASSTNIWKRIAWSADTW
jgi:hypothetical protein